MIKLSRSCVVAIVLINHGCMAEEHASMHEPANAGALNVMDEIQGVCLAAIGNGVVNDRNAVQCHLDYIYNRLGSGTLYFPAGAYPVDGGLVVRGGVALEGCGQAASQLTVTTDSPVVTFDAATCRPGAAMNNFTVIGSQNLYAANDTVTVGDNCRVNLANNKIWFGNSALHNKGVGGVIENCFIWGAHYGVLSQGANWYIRDKLDDTGVLHAGTSFYQGLPVSGAQNSRNHFEECDFSGDSQFSIQIQDATNSAITVFEGGVISAPILINGARWTALIGAKIGSPSFVVAASAVDVAVAASYAFGRTAIAGGGTNVHDAG